LKTRFKRKALIGIPLGFLILIAALLLTFADLVPIVLGVALGVAGLGIYIWGCCSFADAKGYSTAIVLTVVFGVVLPVLLLVALPDKNTHYDRD
jgi:hypothetical protein